MPEVLAGQRRQPVALPPPLPSSHLALTLRQLVGGGADALVWQERQALGASQGTLVSLKLGPHLAQSVDVKLRWALVAPDRLGGGAGAAGGGGEGLVSARRVLASRGHGGAGVGGTLVLDVFNHDARQPVSVLVLDRLPWFARVLAHTMRVQLRSSDGKLKSVPLKEVEDAVISLGRPRQDMTVLEYRLPLAPNSSARVEVEMHKALLHLDDFPPGDMPHGTLSPHQVRGHGHGDRMGARRLKAPHPLDRLGR
jgi:hypothetical protein